MKETKLRLCHCIFSMLPILFLIGCASYPLHSAIDKGDINSAQEIIRSNPKEVNTVDKNGNTPLHFAADRNQVKVVQSLMAAGANPSIESKLGWTPLSIAAWKGFAEITQYLLDAGADVNHQCSAKGTPLRAAAETGHVPVMKILIDSGAEVDAKNPNGGTALYIAAYNGRKEAASFLIEKGANVNNVAKAGTTPLIAASVKGNREIAEILISNGADINGKLDNGVNSVIAAAEKGHLDTIKLLAEKGADIHAKNNAGGNAFFIAAYNEQRETAKYLLKLGAEPLTVKSNLAEDVFGNGMSLMYYSEHLLENGDEKEAKASYERAAAAFESANKLYSDIAKEYRKKALGESILGMLQQSASNSIREAMQDELYGSMKGGQKKGLAPNPYPPPRTSNYTPTTTSPLENELNKKQKEYADKADKSQRYLGECRKLLQE